MHLEMVLKVHFWISCNIYDYQGLINGLNVTNYDHNESIYKLFIIVMMEVMHAQKSPMFGVKNNFQIIKRLHLTSYIRIIYLNPFS
jgi:hypothetical protein